MRRILPAFVACVVTGTLGVASASAATTSVLPGWPVKVGAGTVLPGPGGGVVVVAAGADTLDGTPATVSAFRRNGRRLWSTGRVPGCGNCVDGPARQGVRAVRIADGRIAWQRRTGQPVRGALELRNGLVAVSAGAQYARTSADRLTLLRPR